MFSDGYVEAVTDLRDSQRFYGNNSGWTELLDSEERAEENSRLISEMRRCGLDAGDSFDALAWIVSADGYRTTEQLFRPIVAEYAKDSELASKLAALEAKIVGNETNPVSQSDAIQNLPNRLRQAWQALQDAIEKKGDVTYGQAWEWLNEYREDESYDLPSKATFCDYCSKAAKALDQQRKLPRAGRTGGSIARCSEL